MEIIYKKLEELKPYKNNPRKNDGIAVEKVKESIENFGFKIPVIITRTGEIIAGHTRYKAAKELKLSELPCIIADDLTKTQIKAFRIADNKVAEFSEWDFELLKMELDDMGGEFIGFDVQELDNMFKENDSEIKEDNFDADAAAADITDPTAKRGDIWQLGRHRLMCGDSTSKVDINTLTGINPIYLVFTDPPYGMSAVSKSGVLKEKYKTDILNDSDNSVAMDSFALCQTMFPQANQVWWGANYYSECLPSSECWIVWDKNNGGSDQTDCELAWANFRSVVRQFTMASEKKNRVHPTQKPIRLIAEIVDKFDKQNTFKNILDIFGGSGATLMACEQLGRTCYMMELDEKFCDVIIKRWEEFTHKKAELISRSGDNNE